MEMKSIQVFQLSMEDLSQIIRDAVKSELQKNNEVIQLNPQKEAPELLTREEVAKMLKVSYTTLFLWNRDNKLEAKKIGKRVFYLRSEVMNRLNPVA
jgi:excisionase family DNA binding protein